FSRSMNMSNGTTSAPASPSTAPTGRPAGGTGPAVQRQFVSFSFYQLDPAFRRLPHAQKQAARDEFLAAMNERRPGLMSLSYSTVGLKMGCDFLLWKISLEADAFQQQQQAMNRTQLGAYLNMPYAFLSMTKRSMYIDELDPFHTAESRTHIIP